jgi:hypothetical protein
MHLPTTDGRELVLTRYTEPEPELSLLRAARSTAPQDHRRARTAAPAVVPTFGGRPQQSQALRSSKVLESAKLG